MFIEIASIVLGIILTIYGAYTLGSDNRLNEVTSFARSQYAKGEGLTIYRNIPLDTDAVHFIPAPKDTKIEFTQ